MKKHNYIAIMASLIAMVIISLSFFGCKQNEDPDPGPLAVVLKFKNPDYKNYILANYFEGVKLATHPIGNCRTIGCWLIGIGGISLIMQD